MLPWRGPIGAIARCAIPAILLLSFAGAGARPQNAGQASVPSAPSAQSWVHESWTVTDGLPVNSINAVIQDRTGYIWVATFDGLVRFDGVRFTVFNSTNSDELPSNRIIQLKEGRDGALWLATKQGHVVRFHGGRFTNIPFENGKPAQGLATLFVDSLGGVWLGTPDGLWTVRRDSLTRVGRGTLDARVTAITERRDGRIWVGTDGAGVFRVTPDARVTKVVTDSAIDASYINRLFEDAAGTLWIGSNQGLWTLGEHAVQVKASRPLSFVTSVVQVRATGAVFAGDATGVYRVDSGTAVFRAPSPDTYELRLWADSAAVWTVRGQDVLRDGQRVFTLPAGRLVIAALFDREGSLWLGTDAGGLHRLKSALFTTYSVGEGVGYRVV